MAVVAVVVEECLDRTDRKQLSIHRQRSNSTVMVVEVVEEEVVEEEAEEAEVVAEYEGIQDNQ